MGLYWLALSSTNFVYYLSGYRPKWNPLGPIAIKHHNISDTSFRLLSTREV